MGKYKKEAKLLFEAVGANENIKALSHCVTRLRFELRDSSMVNREAIETIDVVKGVVEQSGQFQIIIGNDVSLFYQDLMELYQPSISTQLKSEVNVHPLKKIMANLGAIFSPIIPAIICGGLVIGLENIISSIYFFDQGTHTLAQISPFFLATAELLGMIGNAVFYFMPIAIVWSIMKKMKGSEILGIVLGITLVSPALLTSYQQLENIKGYPSEVIPAILAGFALVYLERLFRMLSPESVSMLVVPFGSLISAVVLSQFILAPLGSLIGGGLADLLYFLFTSPFSYLSAVLFGGGYMFLVMTGMHHITTLLDLQFISSFGGTRLWPLIALANVAQGSAVLGMICLQRNEKKHQAVNVPACISCMLGVTEPALFGVNKKYGFPFICAVIGSGCAALFAVQQQIMAASIGVGGLPGIFSILPQFIPSYLIALLIAIGIPFILTLITGKIYLKSEVSAFFVSPMEGKLIPLEKVEDQVFSQRLMGDGFAIELEGNAVYAPFDGEVVMTYPTGHAYGIKSQDGQEVLIHIGMDTVTLQGKGFIPLVKAGDTIKQGDKLVEVDRTYILQQGKSLVSPIIFTNGQEITLKQSGKIKALQEKIIELKGEHNEEL
ncbi:MAG: PTS trehalose transporter subunit IIBC [Beduini sp.]|uniref:PTS trehalose transporter subunit IIBC n=1 Tax=Beduini sp. TaxID=1922300 RepID=UPI0011CB283D